MKAREIAAATKDVLLSGQYDFVRCNFANPGKACCPQHNVVICFATLETQLLL
jgi:hypothetical protein